MSVLRTVAWSVVLLLALAGCGGEGEIGEECGAEGADGECVDGAVCGQTKGDDEGEVLECLVVCEEQEDCGADEDCNGVSGTSIKGCRPRLDG
jgi:hypothetical protein